MSALRIKAIGHQPSAISLTSLVGALLAAAPVRAQQPMTLQEAIAIAQRQGLQARAVLDTREAARWRDRAFNARLMPRLSMTGILPTYERAIVETVDTLQRQMQKAKDKFITRRHRAENTDLDPEDIEPDI